MAPQLGGIIASPDSPIPDLPHEGFFQDQKEILDRAGVVHDVSPETEPKECISHVELKMESAVVSPQ